MGWKRVAIVAGTAVLAAACTTTGGTPTSVTVNETDQTSSTVPSTTTTIANAQTSSALDDTTDTTTTIVQTTETTTTLVETSTSTTTTLAETSTPTTTTSEPPENLDNLTDDLDDLLGFPSNRGGLLIDGFILALFGVLALSRRLWAHRGRGTTLFHAARSCGVALSARICS